MMDSYDQPVLLWTLVTEKLAESEWPEVRIMLGEDLVEQSIELHQEVSTLMEILQEYRSESEQCMPSPPPRLPEPPDARDRLKQEIQFFVNTLHEKAKHSGRDPDLVLSRHNSEIIDYAFDSGYSSSSMPSTSRSSSSRGTPVPQTPRSSSGIKLELASMNLSVFKMDTVVEHLQLALREEVDALLQDINYLQASLDDEADLRSQSRLSISREPSLAEMRVERSKLEKNLLSPESPVHESFQDTSKAPPRKMSSSIMPKKTLPSVRGTSASSLGPLKASHKILQFPQQPQPPAAEADTKPRVNRKGQFSARTNSIDSLSQNISHITIKTSASGKRDSNGGEGGAVQVVPVPPSTAKPTSAASKRPRSAQRFRAMVLDCRDGGN